MKRNSLTLFNFFLMGCFAISLFHSCTKDETNQLKLAEREMVTFQNIEEYNAVLNSVLSMSREERKVYEESRGYKSLGRQIDEFYDEIDFDKFESIEELKAFAASNDFILLIEDEDGEIILEKTLSTNPLRYFINSDRLFRMGDIVYKVFEDGTASTHINNLHKLIHDNSFSVHSIPEDVQITISPIKRNLNLKDATYNCGNYKYYAKNSNCGGYRVGIEIEIIVWNDYNILGGSPFSTLYVATTVKSFRKRWYGWAYSERLIEYDVKLAVDTDATSREFHKRGETRGVDGTYTYVFVNRLISDGYHYTYPVHFGAYYCFVKMINHPGAETTGSCNVQLFPWGY